MNNLLHGEFYKLRKSKSFFVCLLALIVMSCFVVGMFKIMQTVYTDEMKQSLNAIGNESSQAGGIKIEVKEQETNAISLDIDSMDGKVILNEVFKGNTLQIIQAIFLALFVVSEYSTGAIKNIVTRGYSRVKVYTAKYIITMIAAEIMGIVMAIFSILTAMVCWGTEFLTLDFIKELLPFLGIQLIINLGVAGFIILVANLSRNIAVSIAVGISAFAFLPLVLSGIDMILQDKFSVAQFWIMKQVEACSTYELTNEIVAKGIGISLIYVITTFVIGAVYTKKADVR